MSGILIVASYIICKLIKIDNSPFKVDTLGSIKNIYFMGHQLCYGICYGARMRATLLKYLGKQDFPVEKSVQMWRP